MSKLMCGHCYRPAVGSVYRRPAWRRVARLPAVAVPCCASCVTKQYGRRPRWGRRRGQ